jgi:4-amino-4-deoxy-L-arabinose transferase-like glycosyltransferase
VPAAPDQTSPADAPATAPRARRINAGFGAALAAIALGALAIRLYYALGVQGEHRFGGDALEFHFLAKALSDTGEFLKPFQWAIDHQRLPTAEKPPLYPAYLAVFTKLGLASFKWNMIASSLLGTGTVAAIGFLGRRVAGVRAGLIAAAIAAVYPMLIALDGSVRSESLYALLIALALLAAYRLTDQPSARRAALLGLAIGLAALTRGEALALVVLLGVPAVWLGARHATARRKLGLVAAVCAGCALLVAPWLARNWIAFDRPTAISTNEGGLLLGANCDRAYYGEFIGTWACFPRAPKSLGDNESRISAHFRSRAFRYIGDHAGRAPVVAGVRLLRTWEAWDPGDQAQLEAVISDRNVNLNRVALGFFYVLAPLAVAGAVMLRRRGQPPAILLAPVLLVSLVALASYGSTRFRAAAEVAIVVLAAVAIDAVATAIRARRADRGATA